MNHDARRPGEPETRPGTVRWYEPRVLLLNSPLVHTEPAIRSYYAAMKQALDEGDGPYVLISDTRHITAPPDAVARRLHAQLAKDTIKQHRRKCVHSLTIVDGAAMRAIYTAVMWFLGDVGTPNQVVPNFPEAIRIARTKL